MISLYSTLNTLMNTFYLILFVDVSAPLITSFDIQYSTSLCLPYFNESVMIKEIQLPSYKICLLFIFIHVYWVFFNSD